MLAAFKMGHFKDLANLNSNFMDKSVFTKGSLKTINLKDKGDSHFRMELTTMENFKSVGIKGLEHFRTKTVLEFLKDQ